MAGGLAPLSVNFTLDGADADGGALSWSIAFGDSTTAQTGTSLPATVPHTYAAKGNFTATLTVTDDHQAEATKQAVVAVTAVVDSPFLVDATKGWTATDTGVLEFGKGCTADGTDCAYFDLPAEAAGKTFTVVFTANPQAAVYYVDWYSEANGYEDTFIGDPGSMTITDTVPATAIQFQVYGSGGVGNMAHLTIPKA